MKYAILTLLASGLFAGEIPSIPAGVLGKAPEARPTARMTEAAQPRGVVSASPAPGVIKETLIQSTASRTIQPDDYILVESLADYTGADRVSIALTTLGVNARAVAILPGWAAMPGNWYNLTDFSQQWAASDHTGLNTPVYGQALKIMLYNTGTTPIDIKQLTVYAVIH